MSDMTNKPPFEDTKPDDTVSKDFNRTVVIAPNHTTTTTYNKTMVFGEDEAPAPVQKRMLRISSAEWTSIPTSV